MVLRHLAKSSVLAIAVAGMLALPATAEAQRRGPVRRPGPVIVIGGGGFGYPSAQIYGPWRGPWMPYGPWGPWGPWPVPYYYGDQFRWASARIEVEPKQTEVYVDGSFAGTVDDFDGFFQRLNVRPGEHEITLYLQGYRTETHQLYFSPDTTQHIKGVMEKLAAGESSGPRPTPAPPPPPATATGGQPPPPPEPQPRMAPEQPGQFGAVSLRVQPADAEITIDGQRWNAQPGEDRIVVRLSAGRHHIEVSKEGYAPYAEDILIRPSGTLTLNVSLSRR